MDITVIAEQEGATWRLIDLLSRSMGRIREDSTDRFTIHFETMAGIQCGPYASLDVALAEIEPARGAFVGAVQAKRG